MVLIPWKIRLLLAACLLMGQPLFASEGDGHTKPFADKTLSGWQEKSFVGNTDYMLVEDQGTKVLKASADKTASVLYKEQAIDLTITPWLEWSWKIESTYDGIDETTREGDDFPARLYVTAQTGLLPWETIAINYVWSSKQPLNTAWQSPYTNKSIMVAVQSGDQLAEHWTSQRRNVADDFKQFFNVEVKELSGYAVMVDGDNASQVGTATLAELHLRITEPVDLQSVLFISGLCTSKFIGQIPQNPHLSDCSPTPILTNRCEPALSRCANSPNRAVQRCTLNRTPARFTHFSTAGTEHSADKRL